jgi:two-component system, chemotaxis family, protein-glutamate methylesterase/glutaminase
MTKAAPIFSRPPLDGAVKVLVVDDSPVVRQMLTRELSRGAGIRVVGSAPDPFVARDMILELNPDVITLDVEMPRMDGITFLRKLMVYHPMPVIILSSLTAEGTRLAIEALEAGAVEVLSKPNSSNSIGDLGKILIEKVKFAANAKVQTGDGGIKPITSKTKLPSDANTSGAPGANQKIIAIGASTGGVQALTELLSAFPLHAPGTVVVQHMPAHFTESFAQRLDALCQVKICEAHNGDRVIPGTVLIAPGGFHTVLRHSGTHYFVEVKDGPEVQHQKPSVDVLFNSVARSAGANAIGALLTGMGADGAQGLLSLRRAGSHTIAQDEQSSIVFGMPMEAIKCGAAESVLPLNKIAAAILRLAQVV